jgi:hypothetical protein
MTSLLVILVGVVLALTGQFTAIGLLTVVGVVVIVVGLVLLVVDLARGRP